MATYYYFAATLPALTLQGALPMTWDVFLSLCDEHLTPVDRKAVSQLERPPDAAASPTHPFIRDWRDKELQIRNAVTMVRAGRTGRDAAPFLRDAAGCDIAIARGVSDAYAQGTPLERERALDGIRWALVEELEGFDAFDSRAVMAYGLKLRLVERWAGIEEKAGRKEADTLIQQDMDKES
jgi:hypothetical protein